MVEPFRAPQPGPLRPLVFPEKIREGFEKRPSIRRVRNVEATQFRIRSARKGEAETLTDLAMRAKAYWGYDAAFMEQCRDELTMTSDLIEKDTVLVADQDGRIVGSACLTLRDAHEGEIHSMFVEPAAIGQGIGIALMNRLLEVARLHECVTLYVDSDPHAQGFYERIGFRYIHDVPSGSIAGRTIPHLTLSLSGQ